MRFVFLFVMLLLSAVSTWAANVEVDVQPQTIRQGELFLVTVSAPLKPLALECSFEGQSFAMFDSPVLGTQRAIGGVSWSAALGTRTVVVSGTDCEGEEFVTRIPVEVVDGQFRHERLRVAPKMANPPATLTARLARERNLLEQVFSGLSAPMLSGAFMRPVPGRIMSPFGSKRVFNGQVKSRHSGVDLRGAMGRPIQAMNSGRVVLARELYFAGTTVVLDHGMGLFSLYAHLQTFDVDEGEFVERGQVVGRVGASGRVTGPHLHLGMKLHGVTVDPLSAVGLPLLPPADTVSTIARVP